MNSSEVAEYAHRAASAATYGGSGTAMYFGLSPGEWQVVGVVGGLLIGAAGFAFNAWLGWRRDQRDEQARGWK
jgi:hypothetical protein